MSLWRIAFRNLRQHLLSAIVTALACALAGGLVMAVFAINHQAYQAFTSGANGYEAVLGARGSALQLVLNTVFHLETSPGNIPYSLYQQVAENPGVDRAVPFALGDNYRGFRIVGTSETFFTDPPGDGTQFACQRGGRFFDPSRREAVVGSFAARQTGLKLGQIFNPYHGLTFDEKMRHAEEYVVVGILEPTNTPVDRVIFIPIEGVYRMEGHVLRGSGEEYEAQAGQPIPEEHREVSAVLLDLSNPRIGFLLDQTVNRQGKVATLAFPIGRVMAEVFQKMGWAHQILALVAYLVMVVAAGSILASIYNTLNERKVEFAVLRALGMRRRSLFAMLVLEAGLIALAGSLAGFFVYAVILSGAARIVREQTGVVFDLWAVHPVMVWGPLAMVCLGCLAGLLPAWRAYASPVASSLR